MSALDVMRRVLTAYETHDLLGMEARMDELRSAIEQAERQQEDFAYREAVSLAKAIFKKHFAHEEHYASGRIVWKPLDTTAGVISQIDNMTCRLVAPPQRYPLTEIAEALRRHGLTLVETAKGYDVMWLGEISAHGIGGGV